MDHGIGNSFLHKFIDKIGMDKNIINKLSKSITDEKNNYSISYFLEVPVQSARIDIVIDMIINKERFRICIENKINAKAAKNKSQLKNQYFGMKEKIKEEVELKTSEEKPKIIVVFLVPSDTDNNILKEFNEFKPVEEDRKHILLWKDISHMINKIIIDEQHCKISPINEYTKHTLKAFSNFIKEGFKGYNPAKLKKGRRPDNADMGYLFYDDICQNEEIRFVGIQRGENTLRKMKIDELKTSRFWCSSKDINIQFWISKEKFIKIIKDRIDNEENNEI
jgi:hypothetical protein